MYFKEMGPLWTWGNLAQCIWAYREKGKTPVKEEIMNDMCERVERLKETKIKEKTLDRIVQLVRGLCDEDPGGAQRMRELREEQEVQNILRPPI